MKPTKISIVTPSWNQGRFLKRCLESIGSSPQVQVEHIVRDNCSDDETLSLLADYEARSDRVDRHFASQKDQGQTSAINTGFSMATGDIVCWLNTDEWYTEGALPLVASFFAENPTVDILYGNCNFVDSSGDLVKARKSFDFNQSMLLYYGCYISSCATFFRRRVIDEGHLLDPSFRVAMDYEYYVRLSALGYKFAHLATSLANFTWHESNISQKQKARSREERWQIQSRYSAIPGPPRVRKLAYQVLSKFWTAVRVIKRIRGANR